MAESHRPVCGTGLAVRDVAPFFECGAERGELERFLVHVLATPPAVCRAVVPQERFVVRGADASQYEVCSQPNGKR
jgi:hypothetical protein